MKNAVYLSRWRIVVEVPDGPVLLENWECTLCLSVASNSDKQNGMYGVFCLHADAGGWSGKPCEMCSPSFCSFLLSKYLVFRRLLERFTLCGVYALRADLISKWNIASSSEAVLHKPNKQQLKSKNYSQLGNQCLRYSFVYPVWNIKQWC